MTAVSKTDKWEEPSLHISHSQIFTYLACSLKYKFQYVQKREPERQSINLLFGSALHTVLERYYLKRFVRNEIEQLNVLTEFFEGLMRLELDFKRLPIIYKKEMPDADSTVEMGKALIQTFYESVNLDEYQIVGVEMPLKAELYDEDGVSTGFLLYGILDLLLMDKNQQCLVVDNKTAAKPKTQKAVDDDLQFSSYAYLMTANRFNTRLDTVNCRMDVLRKLKKPKMEYYHTQRTAEDRKRFAKIATAVLKGIDNQVFIPNKSWLCSDCQFTRACRSW